MSLITDRAVRAVTRVLGETAIEFDTVTPIAYWHGPDCAHRACRIVDGLADAALLTYSDTDGPLPDRAHREAVGAIILTDPATAGGPAAAIVDELHHDRLLTHGHGRP